ncbi:hypothetical protein LTR17_009516 [Elasticomyces elasticus]|nr:hypothetical protein LTR17_009516 [Elasticomyces elasticus]
MAISKHKAKVDIAGIPTSQKRKAADGDSNPKRKTRPLGAKNKKPATRGNVQAASCKTVFADTKLLEKILLRLPAKTVFGVQRVCRQFRDILACSWDLRHKLCLHEPSDFGQERWVLLNKAVLGHEPGDVICIREMDDLGIHEVHMLNNGKSSMRSIAFRQNPLLTMPPARQGNPADRIRTGEQLIFTARGARLSGPGSWKHTYLAGVPCNTATLTLEWRINTRPPLEGIAQLSEIKTETWRDGHSLGTLTEALLRDARTRTTYNEDGRPRSHKGPLGELVERLERKTGRSAAVRQMKMQARGIIIPTAQDKALISTSNPANYTASSDMAPRKRKASDGDRAGAAGKRKAKSGKTAEEEHFIDPADGPRNAVLGTAELLEQILMFVPPSTVFGVQRVCRQFRDILATSAALQGKLWLRVPNPRSDEIWTVVQLEDLAPDWHYNLATCKVVRIPDGDALPKGAIGKFGSKDPPRCHLARQCSPFLKRHAAQTDRAMSPMEFLVDRITSTGEGYITRPEEPSGGYIFENHVPLMGHGSWKNTYLADSRSTDISCKRAAVWLSWSIATKPVISGAVHLCATRTDESHSLTLGMLFAAALQYSDDVENGTYWHEWWPDDGDYDDLHEDTDPLVELIERLQTETGQLAYMESLQVETIDVILPTDAERDMVGDA